MYIRWTSRERRSRAYGSGRGGETHWRAILVESKRIKGKPKQQHLGYLCGFTDSQLAVPAQQRFIWEHIEACLDRLGSRLSPIDRERIVTELAARIGRPPTKRRLYEISPRSAEGHFGA